MAGAFLSPGLFAAAGNLASGERGLGALALVGQVIHNHFMHHDSVGLNPKNGVGKVDLADLLAGYVKYCYIRHSNSSFP